MAKENIVISGIAGTFPKCSDLEEFQTALYEKTNLITDMTSDWKGVLKVPVHLGRTKDFWDFDHTFLSTNLPLANTMDRTCKAFLKQCYSCILDAGYSPTEIRDRNIGCFLHSTLCEDELRNTSSSGSSFLSKSHPALVGVARTMFANRLSWIFNLHGTSLSYSGSYDNSFATLKKACEAVASGEVEAALVGSGNVCGVSPHISLEYQALNLLTYQSLNRPLDENADGYIRADSTVVFFLQRESDARKSYAQVFHVGACFFGDRLGTCLSREEKFFMKLLDETYRECGLKPSDIGYLETGSWANKEMDSQELNLIRDFFAKDRADPLLIGSVVGNTGFTEGSAGFVALVKCIIALRTGVIAPTLHVETPNAAVGDKLKIVLENTPSKNLYVAANVIGLYGNLAHVILKKSEGITGPKYPIQDDLPRLYFMPSRSFEDAEGLFKKLESTVRSKYLSTAMNNVFRRHIRGYKTRSFAVYPYKKAPIRQTKIFDEKRPVWFLFSGMGSQWQAMGKDLMKFPVFAKSIAQSAAVLKKHNVDLFNILTNEEDTSIFDNILNSFVGIASVQIALVDMLFAMGIKPDGMIGHSVGELGCAYADGCLKVDEAIMVAMNRGKASNEAELINGMMAAVGYSHSQIKPYLPPDIEVACHNSASSCTLSGPSESVKRFVDIVAQKGIFAKAVNVSNIAYHSRYIKPAAPLLLKSLQSTIPHPKERSSKWISTSIEEKNWNSDLAKYASAEYFTNNLLSPVFFEEGAHHIPKNAILIEIAPHGLLQAIVKKSLHGDTIHISMTNRSKTVDNIECLLEAIGTLYLNGCEPDVSAIYPPIEYPIPAHVPNIGQFLTWDYSISSNTGLEQNTDRSWQKEVILGICSKQKNSHILNHKIDGKVVIPLATYIDLLIDFFMKKKPDARCIVVENFRAFECDTSVFLKEKVIVFISLAKVSGNFEITCEYEKSLPSKIVASGMIRDVEKFKSPKIPEWKTEIGRLQFDAYLKILKYTVPEEPCLEYLTKYSEGLTGEVLSNGRVFDLIDSCLKIVVIDKSQFKKPEVPYHIRMITVDVAAIRDYKKGKSVQVYYDPTANNIVSSAIIINNIKTKPFILEYPELKDDYSGPVSYFTSMKTTSLDNIDVNYVGIATQLCTNAIVDYSGVTTSGNNIMGIVSYENSKIVFDEIFKWKMPSSWTLEESVTIPLVYSMAYMFLIKQKSCYRTETMKSVFIQCGDTALGEACIALALFMKKKVYTTVSSEESSNIVLKRFPSLPPSHVFLNTGLNYSLQIMMETKGKGVDVIVNTLESEAHLNLCWESMSLNGELMQTGVEETQSLYMHKFLNSQSFVRTKPEVLLKLDDATKKDIQKFISEGISNEVVRPIVSKVQPRNQNQGDVDDSYEVISLKSRQQFFKTFLDVNPDSSYGIIGGEDTHLVAEWLMHRGARKIVLEFSDKFRVSQMSPILEKYGAVLTLSRKNTNTIAGAEAFLNDVRSFGDVAAVLAVNVKGVDCKTKLDNVKQVCVSQKKTIFLLSLLCSESSNWHFELKADGSKTISQSLPSLDISLKGMVKYTISSDSKGTAQNFISSSFSIGNPQLLLDAHLPCQSLKDAYDLHEEFRGLQSPCFVAKYAPSLEKCFKQATWPVFCFPGVTAASMEKLIPGLYYPSFLAHIPIGWSMSDIIDNLYKDLKKIQPKGVYTLMTESWSGIFALKLAEYLEKSGDQVTVILLDASPYLMKDIVQNNKEIFTNESNLVTYIMRKQQIIHPDDQQKASLELSCKIILDRVRHHKNITEVTHKFNGQCILVTAELCSANMVNRDYHRMFKAISEIYTTEVASPYEFFTDKNLVQFVNYNVPVKFW